MNDIDLIKSKLSDMKCEDSYVFAAIKNIELQLELLRKLQETLYSTDLYIVYKHTSPTGKIYIGITKNLPNARWNEGAGYETQKKFYKAIQTYGWINFKHEVIAAGLTEAEAKHLESKLILEFRSNEEEFGYNTQVLYDAVINSPHEKKQKKENKQVPQSKTLDKIEIANKLIESFTIKTVNGTIYYLNDDKYVAEKDIPILNKELLITYGVEPRKHKEIIEHIKILSYARKGDICIKSTMPITTIYQTESADISSFFSTLTLDESMSYFISDDDLYEDYLIWASNQNLDVFSQAEFFRKTPQWISKYRPDIQRLVTSTIKGWEMKTVVMEETSGKVITPRGLKMISDWLDNTNEPLVCIPMICEFVLDMPPKGSRKLSNEICFVIRNYISDWKEIGVARTSKYGNQLCFKRG